MHEKQDKKVVNLRVTHIDLIFIRFQGTNTVRRRTVLSARRGTSRDISFRRWWYAYNIYRSQSTSHFYASKETLN